MPVDATGSVSAKLGIYKYNTGADAPSGKGLNNIVDDLDDIISRLGIAGMVANDVPVYDSVAGKWKKATGTHDGTKFLRDDGTWVTPSAGGTVLLWDSVDAGVVLPAASITTPALSQAYKHLYVVIEARGDAAVTIQSLAYRLNGDSGANYDNINLQGQGATVTSASNFGATSASVGAATGATASANLFAANWLRIHDYANTAREKVVQSYFGCKINTSSGASGYTSLGTFWWRSTAAVTTLAVLPGGGGNLVAGTRVTVYGEA